MEAPERFSVFWGDLLLETLTGLQENHRLDVMYRENRYLGTSSSVIRL